MAEELERRQRQSSERTAPRARGEQQATTSTQSPTSSELALDGPREGLEWLSSREQLAVDEEGGRARHAETNRLVHALLHCGRMGPAREAALEARELQPHLLGIRPELLGTGLGRVGEKRVVILPELPLVVGAPRRLGCVPSLGMEAVHRKVPVHELHFLAVAGDRKSTRLNSSHLVISYAVFCLKKKRKCGVATIRASLSRLY